MIDVHVGSVAPLERGEMETWITVRHKHSSIHCLDDGATMNRAFEDVPNTGSTLFRVLQIRIK